MTQLSAASCSTSNPVLNFLATSETFRYLDKQTVGAITRSAWRKRFARGDVIHNQGARATTLSVVASGLVKLVRCGPDGRPNTLAFHGPREVMELAAALSGNRYIATAVVLSETADVVRLPATPVLSAMTVDARVAACMVGALVRHAEVMRQKVDIMSAGTVPQRLATLFQFLAERFGDEIEGGSIVVPVALSRTELACSIGARVETVIRTLSAWHRTGVLRTLSNGFEIVNPGALATVCRNEVVSDDRIDPSARSSSPPLAAYGELGIS